MHWVLTRSGTQSPHDEMAIGWEIQKDLPKNEERPNLKRESPYVVHVDLDSNENSEAERAEYQR